MARWMIVLDANFNIVKELAPNLLIYISRGWSKEIQEEFPILANLSLSSDKWIDEEQCFHSGNLIEFKNELHILLKVLSFEKFIKGLDVKKVVKYSINESFPLEDLKSEIGSFLLLFENCIKKNYIIRISL